MIKELIFRFFFSGALVSHHSHKIQEFSHARSERSNIMSEYLQKIFIYL